ncbi:MAG: hypothetical protein ACOC0O_05910, partial [Spirochaetota bacterium]
MILALRRYKLLVVLSTFSVVAGCAMLPDGTRSPGVEPADAPVVVDRVEALYENIAESFWAAGAPERSYSLFLNLWIYVDVAADYRATIETARVYDT